MKYKATPNDGTRTKQTGVFTTAQQLTNWGYFFSKAERLHSHSKRAIFYIADDSFGQCFLHMALHKPEDSLNVESATGYKH